jgi:dienelactone hydrolase
MTIRSTAVLALALTISAAAGARAQAVSDLRDGRAGEVRFLSSSPAGPTALMSGGAPGVEIVGTLSLPPGATRAPAMVVVHGSGGVSAGREHAWAKRLGDMGVAAFVTDSFRPRGVTTTAEDQSRVSTVSMVADAFNALKLLASHPRIDPNRIGIMGFSKGGQVSLYTALEPFRRAAGGNLRFATHVPLYPSCALPYVSREITRAPMLVLMGGADDYTPAAQCERYIEWFRGKGAPIRSIVYPGASHGFDSPGAVRRMDNVQTARDCRMDIELEPVQGRRWDDGAVVPGDRIGAYLRECSKRGAHFGGNPAALARATEDLRAHLAATIGAR